MRFSYVELGLVAAIVAAVAWLLFPRTGSSPHRGVVRASWAMTPGALNPDVTQASIRDDDLREGLDAHGPAAGLLHERAQASFSCRSTASTAHPSGYQEDHLISLELGGNPSDPRNLWPEPYPRAAQVDQIENQLNALICSGTITLAEGQRRESALKHADG